MIIVSMHMYDMQAMNMQHLQTMFAWRLRQLMKLFQHVKHFKLMRMCSTTS